MNRVHSTNARTGAETLIDATDATPSRVDEKVAAATQVERQLAEQSPSQRAAMLHALADSIDDTAAELVDAADAETALGTERLRGEVARTSGQFRLFADVVREGDYLQVRIDRGGDAGPELRTMSVPLGVVAIFGASNFPLAFSVPGGDTASALAAGCPVVAKAHPAHPATSEIALAALRRGLDHVGVPSDAVSLVHGLEAGRHLVGQSAIQAVGFTGSEAVGRTLFDAATQRATPIPFYGELGSMNPTIMLGDADPEAFGAGLAASITLGAGQFCTKPGVVFVPAVLSAAVCEALSRALSDAGPFTMLTPAIAKNYADHLAALADDVDLWTSRDDRRGASFIAVDGSDYQRRPTLAAECFGPTTVLVRYHDDVELSRLIDDLDGALTGTIHGDNAVAARPVVEALTARVGRVVWNGYPTGVRVGWATTHGGPYPATTSALHTSVGAAAIGRWIRPVCYQDLPEELLPAPLQDADPWSVPRRIDGLRS